MREIGCVETGVVEARGKHAEVSFQTELYLATASLSKHHM